MLSIKAMVYGSHVYHEIWDAALGEHQAVLLLRDWKLLVFGGYCSKRFTGVSHHLAAMSTAFESRP